MGRCELSDNGSLQRAIDARTPACKLLTACTATTVGAVPGCCGKADQQGLSSLAGTPPGLVRDGPDRPAGSCRVAVVLFTLAYCRCRSRDGLGAGPIASCAWMANRDVQQ